MPCIIEHRRSMSSPSGSILVIALYKAYSCPRPHNPTWLHDLFPIGVVAAPDKDLLLIPFILLCKSLLRLIFECDYLVHQRALNQ